jgi:hypothetical protein
MGVAPLIWIGAIDPAVQPLVHPPGQAAAAHLPPS